MNQISTVEILEPRWNTLFKTGGVAALTMLAIMIFQIIIFVAWPPPDTVEGFFALFQKNPFLGLLSLDLLYLVNNSILILIYLTLYVSVKHISESTAIIALVLGLVGIAAYFASNTSFEILSLSRQYLEASTDLQRTAVLGAGYASLAIYRGTAFNVYYILNAASLLLFASLMLKSKTFSRKIAVIGLVSGIFMVIPSTAGQIGLVFSLASLVPWAIFLVLISRKFFQLGS